MTTRISSAAIAAAVLGLGLATGPVSAEPATGWQGFYLGAHVGYGWTDVTNNAADRMSGAVGGVHGGYNWQNGGFVLGVEADISASGISHEETLLDQFAGPVALEASVDYLGSIRARAGLATGPMLIYGTGGFAYAGLAASASALGFTVAIDDTMTGWVAGGGLEYKLSPAMSARIEGLYYELSGDVVGEGTVGVVRGGIGWHF